MRDIEFDGANLWGSAPDSDHIVHLDLNGNLLHTFAAPAQNITAVAWDGSHLWAVELDGAPDAPPAMVYKLDVGDLTVAALPVVQSFAAPTQESTGMTFDGQHLWIAARIALGNSESRFYQVERATGQVVQSFTPPMSSEFDVSSGTMRYGSPSDLTYDGHSLWYADSGTPSVGAPGKRIVKIDPGGDHRDVTVVDGQASAAAAIGNFQVAAISGKVFNDANQNGVQDAGEADIEGRQVFLDHDGDGQLGTAENVALTDAAGNYQLAGRIGRTYSVVLVLPVGWTQISPAGAHTVSVTTSGQVADGLDFAVLAPPPDPTKFYVVNDGTADRTYEYGPSGAATENYGLATGNTAPRGAASNAAGDTVWVIDANKTVYVYSKTGALLGSWNANPGSNFQPQGITTYGVDVWLVDSKYDSVTKFVGQAPRRDGFRYADSSFALASGNKDPKDLVTDGTHIWVVNDASTNKVFKYTMAGALVGSWTIASPNSTPTGITLDPTGASDDLWIVDSGTDKVYQYAGGKSWTSGTRSASATFNLAAGNTNPQGIADPPVGAGTPMPEALLSPEPAVTSQVVISPSPVHPVRKNQLLESNFRGSMELKIGEQHDWADRDGAARSEPGRQGLGAKSFGSVRRLVALDAVFGEQNDFLLDSLLTSLDVV